MRNIRLYGTEAEFITHEQSAGGDGLTTESIYPGVSMAKDIRKRYFNPHHKVVLIHTLTINYVDPYGVPVSESETKRFKYIPGVTQEVVITPKNVSGYVTTNELPVVVTIPNDSVVNIKYVSEEYEQMKKIPLTLEITSGGYLRWRTSSSSYNRKINYRLNGGSWTSYDSSTSTGSSFAYVSSGAVIEFMGDNANYGSGSLTYGSFSGSTCRFNVKGNIMSLIGSSGYSAVTELTSASTFVGLFEQTQVVDASMLYMPATTALNRCYQYMFYNCTALTTAPLILPATTLGDYCYNAMFLYCTSLTTAPSVLPATTLADNCYSYMFQGCTSLITAPSSIGTSATRMASSACSFMFRGCTSLTTAPKLPASTLAINCYTLMFSGCTSLTTAPSVLPATNLPGSCYESMFRGCTSLTRAPEIQAFNIGSRSCADMFHGCTNLIYSPSKIGGGTLASYCCVSMFSECTNLTTVPELPSTGMAQGCYNYMFWKCANITKSPELPATTLVTNCYNEMFLGCSKLNYITCLATTNLNSSYLGNWVSGVASSGTFVKNPNTSSWTRGVNGIPTNWTVQDATL